MEIANHHNRTDRSTTTIVVSQHGDGDCVTITEALHRAAATRERNGNGMVPRRVAERPAVEPITIRIRPGVYRERVEVTLPHIALIGDDPRTTTIVLGLGARMPANAGTIVSTNDDTTDSTIGNTNDSTPLGTFRTYTMLVDADHVTLRNLTVANDAGDGRDVGQAIALYADGDELLVESCRILGHQDTLFTGPLPPKELQRGGFVGPKQFAPRRVGRQWYRQCLIAGDVDFIFGGATAMFEDCEIRSLNRDMDVNGYVTAASTPEGRVYRYVFRGCRFTGDGCAPGSVYLGRPWRDFARVALVDCELGAHIHPDGWWDWDKPRAHDGSRFSGLGLHGPGFDPNCWPDWTLPNDPAGLAWYSPEHVLGEAGMTMGGPDER